MSPNAQDMPVCDSWEFDDQLWDIARTLQADAAAGHGRQNLGRFDMARRDPAHDAVSPRHAPPIPVSRKRKTKARRRSPGGALLAFLIWAALSLGMAALTCGGILLGWSLWTGRGELWKIGLPIAAGGQISLLMGLVLQIDRFWRQNHRTTARLDKVGAQLHDLKTNAARLNTFHAPSQTPNYMHLDGGSNPQLLLGDLKSQLDSLATKIQEKE